MFRAAVVGFGQNLRSCLVVIFGSSSLYLTGVSAMMEKVTEGAAPKIGFCVETQRFKRKMPGEEVVCATSPRPPQQEWGGELQAVTWLYCRNRLTEERQQKDLPNPALRCNSVNANHASRAHSHVLQDHADVFLFRLSSKHHFLPLQLDGSVENRRLLHVLFRWSDVSHSILILCQPFVSLLSIAALLSAWALVWTRGRYRALVVTERRLVTLGD